MPENVKPDDATKTVTPAPVTDNISTSKHSVRIGGQEIKYTVTTGTMILRSETTDRDTETKPEAARASVFFTAYTKNGVKDITKRPITFSFNGGPGSSSVWLHLGTLGPRKVKMGDVDALLPPPYGLEDNEYSILDLTDLVFIDPVSTGFSRATEGVKAKDFHGFQADIESVGDFIRLYTSRHQRWLSPKFLAGESYGTTRAAGLSGYLQDRHGLYLNGLMLISSILDFSTARFEPGHDLPYILFLPTFTATAWYHQKLEPSLQKDLAKTLKLAEEFAAGDYAAALFKGSSLSTKDRGVVLKQLSKFTGISETFLENCNLRLDIFRFCKELLRESGRTVGRLDSRFKGIDRDRAGENFEYDPSHAAITGAYSAAFNHYVRSELGFESDLPYNILNMAVWPWSYKEFENRFVNVGETMRKAMSGNPNLKVIVANGYFDLATPYFATDYTFKHLALDASLAPNIRMTFYPAGHMMYVHAPSLAQLKTDLSAFIRDSLA
jgi:carboxypeptidase C (cathepsin A)